MTKVGLDFGKTIALIEEDKPFDNAFEVIKMIINKYTSSNVFIVSKARQETSEFILNWLERHNFYKLTGFLKENIYFVEDYADKRTIVDKLKINIFIDDSIKIVRVLHSSEYIEKIIWFRGGDTRLLKEIPKNNRNKIIIAKEWNKIYKTFCKT